MNEVSALEALTRKLALGNEGARPMSDGSDWPPAVLAAAPPRWAGHAFIACPALAWFYGDLVAQWLGARGICLDVCKIFERYGFGEPRNFGVRLQTTPGAPRFFDMEAAAVLRLTHRHDRRLLISVDDDVWHTWRGEALAKLETWLHEADGIVVPTARLAEKVQRFTSEVVVIPPSLPRREEWPARRSPHHEPHLRIGWVGTASHQRDLESIGPAVLELLARWPAVTVVLGGQCVPAWATDHPRVELHCGWWLLPGYYRFVASLDLDVFLCPLLASPWNEAKPCLKPLEAAMLGLPVIASRVGAYGEDLEHETSALLVENTTEAWLAALTRLVEDAELRAHLAAGGYAWASRNTIEATAPLWAALWGR